MQVKLAGVLCFAAAAMLLITCGKKDTVVTPVDETGYTIASGMNGGKIYKKFWAAEAGYTKLDTAIYNPHGDFFSCASCHGPDLMGREGQSINRAPGKTRPNVANLNLISFKNKSASDVFKAIKNGSNPALRRSPSADVSTYDPASNSATGDKMPNYGQILTDAQIWDLVKFLKTETIDVAQLCDRAVASGAYPAAQVTYANIGKDGNAQNGLTLYLEKCRDCHGDDGSQVYLVDPDAPSALSVGKHLRLKPYQDAYSCKFGFPDGGMLADSLTIQQLKDLFKAITDAAQFP